MRKKQLDEFWFRGHEQAAEGLSVGDAREARPTGRAWREGTDREARSQ